MKLNVEALNDEFQRRLNLHWEKTAKLSFIDPAQEVARPLRHDRCVNYVWLNEHCLKRREHTEDDVMCGVPLSYLDKAYANARLYPDTPFMVWADYALFDDTTKFFLESHAYLNAPANVKFMDLRSIEAYADCPYYQPNSKGMIHNKVDLSRVIVLEHVKRTMDFGMALYSDFDVDDVRLDLPRTQELLGEKGIAFGKLPQGERITHYFINNLSPGYIAVNNRGGEFLSHKMLPDLMRVSQTHRSIVHNMFFALSDEFDKDNQGFGATMLSLTTDLTMHPSGYEMPEHQNYRFNNLCGPARLWPSSP